MKKANANPPAEPAVKKAVQAQAAAVKAETAQPMSLKMDRSKLQEALMWNEILGEPKCRKRHQRRSRLADR